MAEKGAKQFGVFQAPTGSYTFGGLRFRPLTVVETPGETAQALDPDQTPIKFFGSQEKADAEVARLREKFAPKPKK